MTFFFNDLFRTLQINVTVTDRESLEAIKSIDKDSDGNVSKEELFLCFKKMLEQYIALYIDLPTQTGPIKEEIIKAMANTATTNMVEIRATITTDITKEITTIQVKTTTDIMGSTTIIKDILTNPIPTKTTTI